MSNDLTITQLAGATGVSSATLRAWEERHDFPRPRRLDGGHRRYDPADVDAIRAVVAERASGATLRGAIDRVQARPSLLGDSVYRRAPARRPTGRAGGLEAVDGRAQPRARGRAVAPRRARRARRRVPGAAVLRPGRAALAHPRAGRAADGRVRGLRAPAGRRLGAPGPRAHRRRRAARARVGRRPPRGTHLGRARRSTAPARRPAGCPRASRWSGASTRASPTASSHMPHAWRSQRLPGSRRRSFQRSTRRRRGASTRPSRPRSPVARSPISIGGSRHARSGHRLVGAHRLRARPGASRGGPRRPAARPARARVRPTRRPGIPPRARSTRMRSRTSPRS